MLTRKIERKAKIAFFAVGHATYWGQFDGLLDSLIGYHNEVKEIIAENEVEIIDYGMIDSNEKAYAASLKSMPMRPTLLSAIW